MNLYRQLHRWHIWLGWLVSVPLILWTLSGLVMVLKPIEEVRGNHLRVVTEEQPLPPGNPAPVLNDIDVAPTAMEIRTAMQRGRVVTFVTRKNGQVERYDATTGTRIDPLDETQAREIVAAEIIGGNSIETMRLFPADAVPFDFRRPLPVWQATLEGGTHVYIGQQTGRVEAVRTKYWRVFDFMWGIHIMDLQNREDTSHPLLIVFTALAFLSLLFAFPMLIMRQRRIARNRDLS